MDPSPLPTKFKSMSSETEGTEVFAVMTVDDSHLFSQSLYVDRRAVVVVVADDVTFTLWPWP